MFNFSILHKRMRSSRPLLANSVRMGTRVIVLLARRLVKFFLDISIRFGFDSFGIRTAMAVTVIAVGFRRGGEAGRRRAASSSSDS